MDAEQLAYSRSMSEGYWNFERHHLAREIALLVDALEAERAALAAVTAERDEANNWNERRVCSWCGEDFEPGDWTSTDCCSCDPVSVSSLPSIIQSARREAQESVEEGFRTEADRDRLAGQVAALRDRSEDFLNAYRLASNADEEGLARWEDVRAAWDSCDAHADALAEALSALEEPQEEQDEAPVPGAGGETL